jgi:exopolyphosphatase/guanosine-5'-triphosphate,3'-diphosphate pyrophosphatase
MGMNVPNPTLAIFDIGSNAVRLTIYNRGTGAVVKKEAELCELGRLDPETQALYPSGVQRAMKTLDRFCQMVRNPVLHVTGVVAVATEAVRRASNGADFVSNIKSTLGLDIVILPEQDEGVYGARGVLAHHPSGDGVVADLGGGSLQLTRVAGGQVIATHSMPIGTLRLMGAATDVMRADMVETALATLPASIAGAPQIYVIGGSWRSLAKLYFMRAGAGLMDVNGQDLAADKLRALVTWLNAVPVPEMIATLTDDYQMDPRRAEVLPVAGRVLVRVMDELGVHQLTVSSAGIRDGVFQAVQSGALAPSPVPKLPVKSHRGGVTPHHGPH